MSLFEPNARINVRMNGREYIEYKKKKTLTKKQREAMPYFVLALFGLLIATGLMIHLESTAVREQTPNMVDSAISMAKEYSWTDLIKIGGILLLPFVVISWILHGVQFRILA